MISTTLFIDHSNCITHSGTFHADEVMATVILHKCFGDVSVFRTSKVPEKIPSNAIVYDIGGGKFDHHQNGGNGTRANDVPYASCGLIWKEFGHKVVENCDDPEFVWRLMDHELMQGIDARDTGALPIVDYPAQAMTLSTVISKFNPTWDNPEDPDFAFIKACEFAEIIFDVALKSVISKVRASSLVENAIDESKDHIMILKEGVPWQNLLSWSKNKKAQDILFVVYPSSRGGYNWKGVRDNGFIQKKAVPSRWLGLSNEELRKVTGVKTATFCHPKGFIGGAETLEDAIALAKIAINS